MLVATCRQNVRLRKYKFIENLSSRQPARCSDDFSSGTSSRSTKLIHGGVRSVFFFFLSEHFVSGLFRSLSNFPRGFLVHKISFHIN